MSVKLRPYQVESVKEINENHTEGITRQLVSLPTGTGKTITFAELTRQKNVKTIILAHREELLKQAKEKTLLVWPDAGIGFCRAEENDIESQITIASIQSAFGDKRLDQLRRQNYKLCIVDECHHAAADSYEKVIEGLGFMEDDPEKLLVGFTATPARGDGVALGKVFQKITYEKSILDMIKSGYLVDLKGIRIKTGIDLSGVKKSHGDYNDSQLSAIINTTDRNHLIVKAYKEHVPGMKAIAFCVDIQHSKDLAEEFNKAGIIAKAAYGSMDDDERENIVRELAAGEIQVVTNCNLFVEGFDEPSIQAVLMCRPTRSNTLYTQMAGRGTRLFPGKDVCIVLDFTDQDNKLCTLGTLLGSDKPLRNGQTLLEAVNESEGDSDEFGTVAVSGKIYAENMDLFGRSAFVWTAIPGGHFKLPSGINEYVFLRNMGTGYNACVVKDNQIISSLNDTPLSLEYGQGVAEDFVRKNNAVRFADKSATWRGFPATDKQISLLRKLGLKSTPNMTRGEASNLLDTEFGKRSSWRFEQPSSKQIYALRKLGRYKENMTKGEAYSILEKCM